MECVCVSDACVDAEPTRVQAASTPSSPSWSPVHPKLTEQMLSHQGSPNRQGISPYGNHQTSSHFRRGARSVSPLRYTDAGPAGREPVGRNVRRLPRLPS